MKRIYIIGPVGSGKTTLAKKLSKKLDINMYELDKVVWDDLNGNIKRNEMEINKLFYDIISNDSWIIEDVGRKIFIDGIKKSDIVYYIDLKSITIYKRCVLRWLKQKLCIEHYNYKPTLKNLFEMLKWAKNDIKNKECKIEYIKNNTNNYKIINKKDVDEL